MANVNLTASVDRDLLRRAKVLADRHDTSISALLNAELRYLVETYELAERNSNRNAALLLAQAHLPMSRLPDQATEAMVSDLQQLVWWVRPHFDTGCRPLDHSGLWRLWTWCWWI